MQQPIRCSPACRNRDKPGRPPRQRRRTSRPTAPRGPAQLAQSDYRQQSTPDATLVKFTGFKSVGGTMGTRTVLVVEDVPELSHLLGMTLELDDRFTPVASARSADEAVTMAQRHTPDAVVLDVSIEGSETGIDVLPDLRKLLPDARIIVFTAHGNRQQQERAISCGASDYIVKGGDLDPLLDSLAE